MNTSRPNHIEKVKKGVEGLKDKAKKQLHIAASEIRRTYQEQPWLQDIVQKEPVQRALTGAQKLIGRESVHPNPLQAQRNAEFKSLSKSEQRRRMPLHTMRTVEIRANADLGIPVSESLGSFHKASQKRNPFAEKPAKAMGRALKGGLVAGAVLGSSAAGAYMTYDSMQRGERLSQYEGKVSETTMTPKMATYEQVQEVARSNGMDITIKSLQLADGTVLSQEDLFSFEETKDHTYKVRLKGALGKKYSLVKVTSPSEMAFATDATLMTVEPAASDIEINVNPAFKRYERIYLQFGENYGGSAHELADSRRFLALMEISEGTNWRMTDRK